jgi:hypothetical protein
VEVLRAYFKTLQNLPEGTDENHTKDVCTGSDKHCGQEVTQFN